MHRELLIKQNDGSWKIWKDGSLKVYIPEQQSLGSNSDTENAIVKSVPSSVVIGSSSAAEPLLSKMQNSTPEQVVPLVSKSPALNHALTFVHSIEAATQPSAEKVEDVQTGNSVTQQVFSAPLDATVRRKMMDVRFRPTAIGPIDELRLMTIDEFRHLGGNIQEVTAHLSQKIQYLGDDSFEQLAAGTQAWRQSPVYRAFLAVVTASLRSNKTVADILPTQELSKDEFMAILNFNRAQLF
ncbi:MAG: hypothetical protein WC817_04860 [Patescibacteria group bacterium]|jgi:hypothetical protein